MTVSADSPLRKAMGLVSEGMDFFGKAADATAEEDPVIDELKMLMEEARKSYQALEGIYYLLSHAHVTWPECTLTRVEKDELSEFFDLAISGITPEGRKLNRIMALQLGQKLFGRCKRFCAQSMDSIADPAERKLLEFLLIDVSGHYEKISRDLRLYQDPYEWEWIFAHRRPMLDGG